MTTDKSIDSLRARRSKIQEEQEMLKLRELHGSKLANALSAAAGVSFVLTDFQTQNTASFVVRWPERIEDAPGLVEAYVSKQRAQEILSCMEAKLYASGGQIGIHNNTYLGLCRVLHVRITGLLDASEMSGDSVVFYPECNDGAILVDCYTSNTGDPFSVLVQGAELIEQFKDCFKNRGKSG
jgi:hypothetical protein